MKSAGLDGSGMSDQHQTPGVDPGHAEEIMSLDWLGVSLEELELVAVERVSQLRLLPL